MHPQHFADVIDEVTETLGAETFTLIGSSMGGATAWQFALKHPERLDGLVLVAASGWPDEGESDARPLVFRLLENPVSRFLMKDLDSSAVTRGGLEDSFVDQSFVTDAMVSRYVSLSRAPGHRDGIIAMTIGRGERVEATVAGVSEISVPTLILQGDTDNLVHHSGAQKFADAILEAELKLYPNVGHLPQEEIADQSAADLADFLARRIYVPAAEEVAE